MILIYRNNIKAKFIA